MKTFLTFLFFGLSNLALCQSFGLIGGYIQNKFHSWEKNELLNEANFEKGSGNFIELNIADFNFLKLPMRASFRVDNYRGTFSTIFPTEANYTSINAEIRNTTISIGFQPINFKVFQGLYISLGTDVSFRLFDRIQGIQAIFSDLSTTVTPISEGSVRYHQNIYWGTTGTVYYRIKIKDSIYLTPQYTYYYGFSKELRNVGFNIKSIRHNIGMGINSTIN